MLIFTFILFLFGTSGLVCMILRAFPRIATIAVAQHKRFSFLGVENVHILEYKYPSDIFKNRFFLLIEKNFRRIRAFLLKFDNAISHGIEWAQHHRKMPLTGNGHVQTVPP